MNRPFRSSVLPMLVLLALFISGCARTVQPATDGRQENFSRVVNNRTLRCGYVSNPPSCIIDPNTKKVSGIVAEAIEAIAASADLKIEWVEEVGFGSMVEGIRTGRYDIVPCAIWPTAARAREADFTNPLFYSGVSAYARAKDVRFRSGLGAINQPSVRVATIDGELAETIARAQFPSAQRVGQPQGAEISTMLLNVQENKADIAFVETYFAHEFLSKNPGSLRNIDPNQPVRIFPNTILVGRGQEQLKAFINTAIGEQLNLGAIDRLLDKYEPAPGVFYRLSRPYRTNSPTK